MSPTTSATATSSTTKNNSNSIKNKRPQFLPNSQAASKKQRTIVHQTHSSSKGPRQTCSSSSTTTTTAATTTAAMNHSTNGHDHIKCIQPNVQGVEEGARIMRQGQVLAIPTETVYVLCTCIDIATTTLTTTATLTTHDGKEQQEGVQQLQSLSIDPTPQATILLHSLRNLDSLLSLTPKSFKFAPHQPVAFHEGYQVLLRLATKVWPGPICMYLSTTSSPSTTPSLPSCVLRSLDNATFVALQYPSHPLTTRMLQQVYKKKAGANYKKQQPPTTHQQQHNSTKKMVVISTPAINTQRYYLTTAKAVVDHYYTKSDLQFSQKMHPCRGADTTSDNTTVTAMTTTTATTTSKKMHQNAMIHVLQGEDRMEWLSAPTCTYGKPSGTSLWIHTNTRTVYMVGDISQDAPAAVVTSKQLLHAMNECGGFGGSSSSSSSTILQTPTTLLTGNCSTKAVEDGVAMTEHAKYRSRVITAVLRKWKVVDQRTTHRVQEQEEEEEKNNNTNNK